MRVNAWPARSICPFALVMNTALLCESGAVESEARS